MRPIYGRLYCVTNLVNGKQYVGKTTLSVQKRWSYHCRASNQKIARPLSRAIMKYGASSFSVHELCGATSRSVLDQLERHYIAMMGTRRPHGYNLALGGEGGPWHQESREKLSATKLQFWSDPANKSRMLGRMVDPVVMAKRVESFRRSFRDETRRAQWSLMMKSIHTTETRAAASARSRAMWARDDIREKISAAIRLTANTPEQRRKRSALRKADWSDPDKRARYMEASRILHASPEYRDKMSAALKAKCVDAEWLARRTAAIVAAKRAKAASQ